MNFFVQLLLFIFGLLVVGLVTATVALIIQRLLAAQLAERRRVLREEFRLKLRAGLADLSKPGNNGIGWVAKSMQPKGKDAIEAFKNAIIDVYGESDEMNRENLVTFYEVSGMMSDDVKAIYSGSVIAKSRSVFRLGRLHCNGAIEALTTATRHPSTELRLVAIWAMTEINDTRAVQPVVVALSEADGWQLMQAANRLIEMEVDLTLPLLDLLNAAGAMRERRERIAATILDLISDFGLRSRDRLNLHASRHAAGDLMRSESVDIRTRAIRAMAALGIESSSDTQNILRSLDDAAWEVRAVAARAVGDLNLTEAIPDLCRAVSDKAWWVRHNAAHALKKLGEPGELSLLQLMQSEDRFAREIASQVIQGA